MQTFLSFWGVEHRILLNPCLDFSRQIDFSKDMTHDFPSEVLGSPFRYFSSEKFLIRSSARCVFKFSDGVFDYPVVRYENDTIRDMIGCNTEGATLWAIISRLLANHFPGCGQSS
jgi:hypothetical protein